MLGEFAAADELGQGRELGLEETGLHGSHQVGRELADLGRNLRMPHRKLHQADDRCQFEAAELHRSHQPQRPVMVKERPRQQLLVARQVNAGRAERP